MVEESHEDGSSGSQKGEGGDPYLHKNPLISMSTLRSIKSRHVELSFNLSSKVLGCVFSINNTDEEKEFFLEYKFKRSYKGDFAEGV